MNDSIEENSPNGFSVLIVDDSDDLRKTIAAFVSSFGVQVAEAKSAEDALLIVKRDLNRSWLGLITDYQMEDRDGVYLIRTMKQMGIRVGFWILTSGIQKLNMSIENLINRYPDVFFIQKPHLHEKLIYFIRSKESR